jgi:hypothetical protein
MAKRSRTDLQYVHELDKHTEVCDYEQLNVKSVYSGKSVDADQHVCVLEQQTSPGTAA